MLTTYHIPSHKLSGNPCWTTHRLIGTSANPLILSPGGEYRIRTDDPLLAKQVL